MSNLKYKTKGNSSPNKKQRVYFCCHPKDFKRYFDEICEDIFKNQNCVLYYHAIEYDDTVDEEELIENLSQMQLFVVPVTSTFLVGESRAKNLELKYAVENHIPVLPLMQERGEWFLELFSKVFGDVQYLDKNAVDDTSISYDEKLKRFLSSVLVGDEVADKVRGSFHDYIFLSYRKKDRKYAQKLMRLIHKNDFCQDVAIWYDEYLTPGENFNDEIAKVIDKSSLFALAVTPNLLEKDNYIIKYEYPMAKELGKNILCAELVSTNMEELKKVYVGIPELTDVCDEKILKKKLMGVFNESSNRGKMDPERSFFIGLAYLLGIDVEVDHERAVELITCSAHAGFDKAIEKLVAMYRNGEGVKRNYETAIHWQKELVKRKTVYLVTRDEREEDEYLLALCNLGDYLYELHRIDESESVYFQILDVSKEICAHRGSQSIKKHMSSSYIKLGDIKLFQKRFDDAAFYYINAYLIDKELYIESRQIDNKRLCLLSYTKLGLLSQKRGEIAQAKKYYKKSFDIAKEAYDETRELTDKRSLSSVYIKLGDIAVLQGDLVYALSQYQDALMLIEELLDETSLLDEIDSIAKVYAKIGSVFVAMKDFEQAELCYNKLLLICKEYDEKLETIKSKYNLLKSYDHLGNLKKCKGDWELSKKYYEQALVLAVNIDTQAKTIESSRTLSLTYINVGDVLVAMNGSIEASDYYSKAIVELEELYHSNKNIESKYDLAIAYYKMGNLSRKNERFEYAELYYQSSIDILVNLCKNMDDVNIHHSLALVYFGMGSLEKLRCIGFSLKSLANRKKCKGYFLKSYEIWQRLCAKSPDNSEFFHYLCLSRKMIEK